MQEMVGVISLLVTDELKKVYCVPKRSPLLPKKKLHVGFGAEMYIQHSKNCTNLRIILET